MALATSVEAPDTPRRRQAGAFFARNAELIVTPFFLVLFALGLALVLSNAELDFTEQRQLNWDVTSQRIWETIELAFASTVLVLIIAIPAGIVLTRRGFRRASGPLLSGASIGQAIPAYGLFILFFAWNGQGFTTAVWALTVFSILPVLRNTMIGLEQVDAAVIEAGQGMGMTRLQALRSIELPLAVPVILAGVRTALVINIGMSTLAFLVGGGGLGETIYSGIQLSRNLTVVVGAATVAILALAIDWLAAMAERWLRPKGLRGVTGTTDTADPL